jgi:membrane protease YdiL (CAAX protease family)
MSVMRTYPAQSAAQEPGTGAAPSRRYPWRFWSTLGWAVLANAALVAVHYVLRYADSHVSLPFDRALLGNITSILSMLAATLVFVLAAHRRGPSARAYLALVWPRWHHCLIALGAVAALFVARLGLEYIFPADATLPGRIILHRTLLDHPAQLVVYWLVAVVTAPIFEEICRSFLLRGWSESRIGFLAALLLSTLIFVPAYTTDVRDMAIVPVIGLALGLTRWWSGSTLLAITMHAGWNFTYNFIALLMALRNG